VTGDAVIDWMPFLNDGYPEEPTFKGYGKLREFSVK
jgi:hypothetical protein